MNVPIKTRLRLYNYILKQLKDPFAPKWSGLCAAMFCAIDNVKGVSPDLENEFECTYEFDLFPEIQNLKPHREIAHGFWFPEFDTAPRIALMKQAIADTKKAMEKNV